MDRPPYSTLAPLAGAVIAVAGIGPLLIGSGAAEAISDAVRDRPDLTSPAAVVTAVVACCLGAVVVAALASFRAQRRAPNLDRLTGLPLRGGLEALLDEVVTSRRRDEVVGLVLVDLERLAEINSTHGLAVGDRTLEVLARRLASLASERSRVARIGGDEFAVLHWGAGDADEVEDLARSVLEAVRTPVDGEDFSLSAGGHVGFAYLDAETEGSAATLWSRAETARYRASRSGSAGIECWVADSGAEATPAQLHSWIDGAIGRGELTVLHQPIIDLATTEVVATEALLRWNHPTQGLLRPFAVLRGLEDSGHIITVGRFVIDQICAQVASWNGTDPSSTPLVFLNISARQLSEGDLAADVAEALARHGVDGRHLGFELSQLAGARDLDGASTTLRECRTLGVRLALDNVGRGSINFDLLSRLPLDYLKLDRRLLAPHSMTPRDQALTRGIIGFADSLGCSVIAEGIETADGLDRARSLGCPLGQGYFLGRPADPESLAAPGRAPQLVTVR